MENPSRLDLVHKAIGALTFGNIEWKNQARERMRNDPKMLDFTESGIRELLREFVLDGNKLEVRPQGFEHWLKEDPDNPYWYRARIPVPEFPQPLFVEVIISSYDEDEPFVQIVSVHF